MKLKLTDLQPHLLKRTSPVDYDFTDVVGEAEALELLCPACHWSNQRTGKNEIAHMIILWRDPERWQFVGRNYKDLSLMAGRITAGMTGGSCGCQFYVKDGKVDFYREG